MTPHLHYHYVNLYIVNITDHLVQRYASDPNNNLGVLKIGLSPRTRPTS